MILSLIKLKVCSSKNWMENVLVQKTGGMLGVCLGLLFKNLKM